MMRSICAFLSVSVVGAAQHGLDVRHLLGAQHADLVGVDPEPGHVGHDRGVIGAHGAGAGGRRADDLVDLGALELSVASSRSRSRWPQAARRDSIGTTSVSSPSAAMPALAEERSWSVPRRPVAVASPPMISSIRRLLDAVGVGRAEHVLDLRRLIGRHHEAGGVHAERGHAGRGGIAQLLLLRDAGGGHQGHDSAAADTAVKKLGLQGHRGVAYASLRLAAAAPRPVAAATLLESMLIAEVERSGHHRQHDNSTLAGKIATSRQHLDAAPRPPLRPDAAGHTPLRLRSRARLRRNYAFADRTEPDRGDSCRRRKRQGTLSITWITPFDSSTSATVTLATFPSPSRIMIAPPSVVAVKTQLPTVVTGCRHHCRDHLGDRIDMASSRPPRGRFRNTTTSSCLFLGLAGVSATHVPPAARRTFVVGGCRDGPRPAASRSRGLRRRRPRPVVGRFIISTMFFSNVSAPQTIVSQGREGAFRVEPPEAADGR